MLLSNRFCNNKILITKIMEFQKLNVSHRVALVSCKSCIYVEKIKKTIYPLGMSKTLNGVLCEIIYAVAVGENGLRLWNQIIKLLCGYVIHYKVGISVTIFSKLYRMSNLRLLNICDFIRRQNLMIKTAVN